MELRGYDHYEVTLGDEIRGERASMGKTLADAERDLRIKADLLLAIENCDISCVPNPSLLPGYVRSYARYLGMDVERFYARFCEGSGFVPPRAAFGGGAAAGTGGGGKRLVGSPFDQSRFAVPPAQTRFAARVSLGALVSGLALMALTAGLGYGGYALLQNIQRVGIAPLPDAPEVVAVAPEIALPRPGPPEPSAYAGGGALAAVYAADDTPPARHRDGPISAIDPGEYGVYAGADASVAPRLPDGAAARARTGAIDSADDAIRRAEARESRLLADQQRMAARLAALSAAEAGEAPAPAGPRGVTVQATDRAWIRVRNADRAVIREGILAPGERYVLPERVIRGTLHAGNAGAIYLIVDGEPYGPLGPPGGVIRNVSLAPEDVRAEIGRADPGAAMVAGAGEDGGQRAAAD